MKQFSLKMYDFYFHKIKGLYNACVVNVIKGMLLFIIFLVTVHFLTNIKLKKGWGGKKKKKKSFLIYACIPTMHGYRMPYKYRPENATDVSCLY